VIFPRFACLLVAAAGFACAGAPAPTAASIALAKNPRATIEGRVVSEDGSPVPGLSVYAMPRGKDIPWSPPATTDSDGRFRLSVFAPAEYGFILRWEGRTVITPREEDPARLAVAVRPGDRREGIDLVFLREAWKDID
jgi:hypothetical protein